MVKKRSIFSKIHCYILKVESACTASFDSRTRFCPEIWLITVSIWRPRIIQRSVGDSHKSLKESTCSDEWFMTLSFSMADNNCNSFFDCFPRAILSRNGPLIVPVCEAVVERFTNNSAQVLPNISGTVQLQSVSRQLSMYFIILYCTFDVYNIDLIDLSSRTSNNIQTLC
jgi:hypothetical protein